MRTFENPMNGHRESVGAGSAVAAFFLGIFYLMYRGLWSHVIVIVLLSVVLGAATGGPGLLLMLPVWIIYAVMAPGIIATRYLRRGWKEVGAEPEPRHQWLEPTIAMEEKKCPFCAEVIKAAAVKCKHCGSDLSPGAPI